MILAFVVFSMVIMKVGSFTTPYHASKKFSYGVEAERLCKAYRKVCPTNKVCVIQHLIWPRKMSFPVCVRERKIALKSKVCELPPAPGRCGARFRRWYFNVHAGKCSWFTFGGCDGNLNNFRNEEECERVCIPQNATDQSSVSSNAIISVPAPPPKKPAVLHHPAPVPLQMKPDDIRQALELKEGTEESLDESLLKPKKLRRRHRKGRKGRKGKGRKGRRRRKGKGKKKISGPYAELRVKKTSFRKEEPAQNDEGGTTTAARKNKVRRLKKLRRGRNDYYNDIKLFRILATRDNPQGITLW